MSKQVRVTLQTKDGPVKMELSDESMLETALTFPDWTKAVIERGRALNEDETRSNGGGGSLDTAARDSRIAHADMKASKRRGAMLALLHFIQDNGPASRIEATAFLKRWGSRAPWGVAPGAVNAGYLTERDGRLTLTRKGEARVADGRLTAMPKGIRR